ncbi:HlyD family efflux transporter periplasmic adaptor subunit [Pontibacter sp. SGAir0037]|uniref:HlyD family efflux transporter periplasmic adaptor subunit n=1 Tax=Pontibacter sp. SGAir0037 TaxID=2571030 RepID=UPI0010CCC811|nr:HlyD family efflux transporter periplasmic adaptor subunit [Pontibacter sp. SGAir0037]QCR22329.1 hypothetical protein C1N53_08260 [Pontibacter sp. SGAir0037]
MPLHQPATQEHSEEVQEIIGAVPGWLVRWGISLFFGILLLLLLLAGSIKSPDSIPANLKVDADYRPQEVLARKAGRLARLLVKEEQAVSSGQVLGYLESNADHREVLQLSSRIDSLQKEVLAGNDRLAQQARFNARKHYGELQPALQEFYLAYLQFLMYTPGGIYAGKEQALRNEIHSLKQLELQLAEQQQIHQEAYAIAQEEFARHQVLAEAKVISLQEFQLQESKFVSIKLPLNSTRSSLINNSIVQAQKQWELQQVAQEVVAQRAVFLAKLQKFKSELDEWKKEHVLVAEQDGRVVFHQVLRQNQWLPLNKPVLYITNARQDAAPFGELTLSQQAFGKVRTGQDVLIRLKAYPTQEFGLLRGKITYISDVVSGDTAYTATVTLPTKTTYGKEVKLQVGLVAQAEVVTEERSLLGRIFNSARDLLTNR